MNNTERAYWRGFMKAANMGMPPMPHSPMPPMPPPPQMRPPGPQMQQHPQQPVMQHTQIPSSPAPMIPPQSNPQMTQLQTLMHQLPMQQQQQFEKQLAGKFGVPGQTFQQNLGAHV